MVRLFTGDEGTPSVRWCIYMTREQKHFVRGHKSHPMPAIFPCRSSRWPRNIRVSVTLFPLNNDLTCTSVILKVRLQWTFRRCYHLNESLSKWFMSVSAWLFFAIRFKRRDLGRSCCLSGNAHSFIASQTFVPDIGALSQHSLPPSSFFVILFWHVPFRPT